MTALAPRHNTVATGQDSDEASTVEWLIANVSDLDQDWAERNPNWRWHGFL